MSKLIKMKISDEEHETRVREADGLGKKRSRFYSEILERQAARIIRAGGKKAKEFENER